MPKYKMVVLSHPAEGREEEFNDWYQNVHLGQMVALEGFTAARRFRLARNLDDRDGYPYMAIYDIETDDIDAVVREIEQASQSGQVEVSDVLDRQTVFPMIFEEFGEEVTAS